MNETIVVENGQAAVATTSVSGELSPKSSPTDIITVVKTADGDHAAVKVFNLGGGGGGGADYSAEIEALNNAVSVLETSANLLNEIGGKTTVALSELTAMDIDGRPSYKQAGATVYAENGVVGIIDSVDSTNAVVTTVQYGVGDIATVLNAINGEDI